METRAVEDVLAGDGEETGGIVHALETDRTCWKFDEIWSWRREGFEVCG